MGNCCRGSAPESSEAIIVQNASKPSKNGIENVGFIDANFNLNHSEKIITESTETNQNNVIEEQKNDTKAGCFNDLENGDSNQKKIFPENGNIKKNKLVTWAATVNDKNDTNTTENVDEKSSEEIKDNSEHKSLVVPIIVVEHVSDVDSSAKKSELGKTLSSTKDDVDFTNTAHKHDAEESFGLDISNSSTSAVTQNEDQDSLVQTSFAKKKDSLDSAFSEDDSNSDEEHQGSKFSPKNPQRKIFQEIEDADCKRISSHLQNMEDHIQKLGSLIDRFDGVFVQLLHDEIEGNLRCCGQNVSDVECSQNNDLRKRQEAIQLKIQKYLVLLDAKSEKKFEEKPETVDQLDIEDAISQSLKKIKELEEKVETLCVKIYSPSFSKDQYNEAIKNLEKYNDQIETNSFNENEESKNLKNSLQEKIQKYINISKEKQMLAN